MLIRMDEKTHNHLYEEYYHTPINELRKQLNIMRMNNTEKDYYPDYDVMCEVLDEKQPDEVYGEAVKNRDKTEFDWDRNSSCLDFHLIVDYQDNYYFSGSMCYDDFEYYDGDHLDEKLNQYSLAEFKKQSRKAVLAFMNRKNKKVYRFDEHIGWLPIKLWNYKTEQEDKLILDLKLTYCP